MMYPPSLAAYILDRSFAASNGELGILPSDVPYFLEACRRDRVKTAGWELWLLDPQTGSYSGLMSIPGSTTPVVFTGSGDLDQTERELAALKLADEVGPAILPNIRVNFTLDD